MQVGKAQRCDNIVNCGILKQEQLEVSAEFTEANINKDT